MTDKPQAGVPDNVTKKTVITLWDGDEPGSVAMVVEHFPALDSVTREEKPGIHYVVGLCIARLWDLSILQSLTGSICHDVLKEQGLTPDDETG